MRTKRIKRLLISAAILTLLTACETAPISGGGSCDFYRTMRAQMPDPEGSHEFLSWVNEVDAGMLAACT